jgi:hypothetical protein
VRFGQLQIQQLPAVERRYVIGAAPNQPPYWLLTDTDGRPAGRLALLFGTDAHARRVMERILDRSNPEMKFYVERSLRQIVVSERARVLRVSGGAALREWQEAVMARRCAKLPRELAALDADALQLPSIVWPSGKAQVAVVRETAIGSGLIQCGEPRPLTWVREPRRQRRSSR